ncbi:HHIP-like protein 1 [Saccostrea echinata]|uniref:HHIP-like protein 1 n=1 Tax=Saccostrea echinata TaxID=191078 RepID=UPI002A83AE20|nr:HHIP-like protein 1 [Saccostrea echinata]
MFSWNLFPTLLYTSTISIVTSSLVLGPNATRPCVCLQHYLTTKKALLVLEEKEGAGRFFVMEQQGLVYSFSSNFGNKKLFLNLTSFVEYDENIVDERGLLSMALHPRFSTNGKLYTYSIRKLKGEHFAFVTELQEVSGRVDVSKEKLLMVIHQHNAKRNGGQLLFGKDGYLYISVGDGGLSSSAQNMTSLLGKILRIDIGNIEIVNNQIRYYVIPPDNPGVNGLPEIYAWGFRNPWRCSLDTGSSEGDIYCGDPGEGDQEEIDFIQKGRNYGWDIKEGDKCVSNSCNITGLEGRPVYVYNHSQGPAAVIGGYVYRGNSIKNLTGRYIFADIFAKTFLYTLEKTGGVDWKETHLYYCDLSLCPCHAKETLGQDYLVSFSQDNKGEVYLLSTKSFTGKSTDDRLLKLVPPNYFATTCSAPALTSHLKTIYIFVSFAFYLMIKKYFNLTFFT